MYAFTKRSLLILLAACAGLWVGCDDVEEGSTVYTPEQRLVIAEEWSEDFVDVPDYANPSGLPAHFRQFGFTRLSIPERYKVHLGRALFYDTRLSLNEDISCGSCHRQESGFADVEAFSTGTGGSLTSRNSQSINNIRAYYGDDGSGFFWDARATSLQGQATSSMANPEEMGMSLEAVQARLSAIPAYRLLFQKAYPDDAPAMRVEHISDALAAFTRNVTSTGSRFDQEVDAHVRTLPKEQVRFGEGLVAPAFTGFTALENAGKSLYLQNCASCHSSQLPTRLSPRNNGLYATGSYPDRGVGELTNSIDDAGFFKTPQLRNVALTAPYMHDGSMRTLEEVIEHYSTGIEPHFALSTELRLRTEELPTGKRGFNFTEEEKTQLIAFLHTLTDTELVTSSEYSDPNL